MVDRTRHGALRFIVFLAAALSAPLAGAQIAPPPTQMPPPAPSLPPSAPMPPPVVAQPAPPPAVPETVATPDVAATAVVSPDAPKYGIGTRLRWISVPSWFLGLFTQQNVPLSSFSIAGEFFRRKGDLDIILGIGYQNMSPPDGNWLGKGEPAALETDFIQFRGLALLGLDASFIWRNKISDYFGFRYGAGLGIAIVLGEMLRVSASNCNETNVADTTQCKPRYCMGVTCTEDEHVRNQGTIDNGPPFPSRFKETSVPGALPIINVLLGVDFRHPDVKGFELRLEGGFYDAFFLGMAAGYQF